MYVHVCTHRDGGGEWEGDSGMEEGVSKYKG